MFTEEATQGEARDTLIALFHQHPNLIQRLYTKSQNGKDKLGTRLSESLKEHNLLNTDGKVKEIYRKEVLLLFEEVDENNPNIPNFFHFRRVKLNSSSVAVAMTALTVISCVVGYLISNLTMQDDRS